MKRSACVLLAVALMGLAGCKPDAAVKTGATIDESSGTGKDNGKPHVVAPAVEQTAPLKKVQ